MSSSTLDNASVHEVPVPSNSTVTVQHVPSSIKLASSVHISTGRLVAMSPYFQSIVAGNDCVVPASENILNVVVPEQSPFRDIDDFSLSLFAYWLENEGKLSGPHDFHSLAHYLGLYVLARRLEMETLQNEVLDLVRQYYREQNMTAPGARLEYIYTNTQDRNRMRAFLISTAAFRALEEHAKPDSTALPMWDPQTRLSESIRGVLIRHPEMAVDFAEELINLHRNDEHDARRGPDCVWHLHTSTPRCAAELKEAWQSDGTFECMATGI